jgi:hypothetical protein
MPALEVLGAIRRWTREFAAATPGHGNAPTAVRLASDESAQLEATATAAGIDVGVLRAALANPAAALGGLDVVFAAGDGGARGLAIGFGRHAEPSCTCFSADGVTGTLLGIAGLPGGIASWNDAGLVVVAHPAPASSAGGLPVTCAVERLAACRSLADADRVAAALEPIAGGLFVMDAAAGGVHEIGFDGRLSAAAFARSACGQGSAVVKVAGDGTGGVAVGRMLAAPGGAVRDGLSATGTWLAAGAVDGSAAAFAGSPLGDWLAVESIDSLTAIWRPAAARQAATAAPPATAVPEVTGRFALALAALPPAAPSRSLAGERMLILAGADAAGQELARHLAGGFTAAGGSPLIVTAASAADAVAAIDAAESRGPVRHLVISSPWSAAEAWVSDREAAVAAGYFACQRWLAVRSRAGDAACATLTAVTGLGGDFGISGGIASAVGGGFAGLLKGLAREYPDVQVRVADVAATEPAAQVAAEVVGEVRSPGPVEVGWQAGRRQTVVAAERPPAAVGRLAGLARGSVWLATGGARGVTAACARALAARHGLSLVLVGSTRPVAVDDAWPSLDEAGLKSLKGGIMLDAKARGADPRRAWREVEKSIEIARELAKFRAAGIAVRYETCDLADGAAVRDLVRRVEREVGPIRGIVHGAGWESACKFEKKTAEGLAATLGPKCVGLEHVLAAVNPQALESVVAFGSTSGRLGGLGQADYSLANDMLAKMVGRLRRTRPGVRATVFHWHAWDEVGMASRPESRFVLEQFGMRFMPLAEGVGRFLAEIEAGLPEAEVLVTEHAFCLDAPSAAADGPRGSLVTAIERTGAETNVVVTLDPSTDVFLTEHRQHGRPLLPAVMGAELLSQAAIAAGTCDRVEELRDFVVEWPLGFPDDQVKEVRIEVAPAAGGCVARAWSAWRSEDAHRVHFSGVVAAGPAEPITSRLDEMPFPWNPMVYQEDGPMWHGPAFRTLTGLFLDRSGGWGRLQSVAPDVVARPRGAAGWTVPVAALDGAIVACAVYSYILCGRRVEIPVRFERLRIVDAARPGETCTVRLLFREQDPQRTVYDFVIYGADGRAILALDGLHLAVLSTERSRPA